MADSRNLVGLGMPAQLAGALGGVPTVVAGVGTTQSGAARINSHNCSLNAQTSNTAFYLATATAASLSSTELYGIYFINNSTLSTGSPIIFVGVGGYMNGVINGSITLSAGQTALAWQQAPGVYYTNKTA